MTDRYSVVLDPCGAYFLWDEVQVEPVMGGADILAFTSRREAEKSALELNGGANDNRHQLRRLVGGRRLPRFPEISDWLPA